MLYLKKAGVYVPVAGPVSGGGAGIAPSIVDAKGDIIVATGADTVARKAVGTAGQLIVADPSQADGLRWVSQTIRQRCTANTAQSVLGTYSNPTGFSGVPILSGKVYRIQAVLLYTSAAATTALRPRLTASGGATMTDLFMVGVNQTSATASEMMSVTALATDLAFTTAVVAGSRVVIDASLKPAGNTTLNLAFTTEVNGSAVTVQAGSYWLVEEVVEG